jgi:exopolysaccharide production protein ExoQ
VNPTIASLICASGIAGLFYLGRDPSVRTSKALWLPVVYLWIIGSRPISFWLGITPASGTNVQLDGSPVDAVFFALLLAGAVGVLMHRGRRVLPLISANWLILSYFSYCLISIVWTYYPDVAFKRWIKAVDDLAMVLVIVTDEQPIAALRRLFSRIGFVLFPTSVLFIKYYDLGRGYTPDGEPINTGVTTNKNSLGLIVLVISLGALWNVRSLLLHKDEQNRGRRLVAQGTLLAFGLTLLMMADCSTCKACFMLGGGLLLATNLGRIKRRPLRVHALCLTILLTGGIALLFGGEAGVVEALGRKTSLSGRTEIWAAVIPAVPNPIIGAGFENFWIGPDAKKVWGGLVGWWHPEVLINEAHNGFLEVYANLGWIGVTLIGFILVSGYRRAVAAFRRDPELGGLLLAYVAIEIIYSITEASFRIMIPSWIFFLLAVVSATRVSAGVCRPKKAKIFSRRGSATRANAAIELIPVSETAYTVRLRAESDLKSFAYLPANSVPDIYLLQSAKGN